MSESDVPSLEMSGSMGPDDGFERLLRGETPKTPEEQALGLFLQDVGGAFQAEPSLEEEAHIAAIVRMPTTRARTRTTRTTDSDGVCR